MPIVTVEMLKGRTLEQKRQMAKEVTEAVSRSVNCPKESVKVIINEMDTENFAEAGVLRCDKK
ncbi:MAG: 2-hydroxymuconate tautomerase family protein [Tissierellia bacterium]|nr:2-hydroxymuconate tautomerase family protein [Tissierellia bacterium]